MPAAPLSRRSKAITIVPLALLSGAWTVSLVSYSSAGAAPDHDKNLPDGTSVPHQAIQAPANVPVPGAIAPGVPAGSADSVVSGASTSGIPAPALAAYQRAAQIIDQADKSCNIPWELIGAIGRVESDHGRYGGSVLTDKGISRPGIYGPELDGKNNTQAIMDTDGGQLDNDKVYDRAVGPMQFIPSTWQVVKVDADGDGQRNPQDINDAALATAVYLCSGNDNLATRKGQETAVYRYNHSHGYVNLVLRIMEAYAAGDYTSVPSGSYAGTLFSPSYSSAITQRRHAAKVRKAHGGPRTAPAPGSTGSNPGGTGSTGSTGGPGGTGSTGGTGGTGGVPSAPGTQGADPLKSIGDAVKQVTSALPTPLQSAVAPVVDLLNQTEATSMCSDQLTALLGKLTKLVPTSVPSTCGAKIAGKTPADGQAAVTGVLETLLRSLGLGNLL